MTTPQATTSNTGRFVWYELLTPDTNASVAFYGDVVGWKTEAFEGGGGSGRSGLNHQTPRSSMRICGLPVVLGKREARLLATTLAPKPVPITMAW